MALQDDITRWSEAQLLLVPAETKFGGIIEEIAQLT